MFEKFPQLKRLERLLNKAQGFSPNHSKNAAQRHGLNDSPIDILQDTTKGTQPRGSYLDTFDSIDMSSAQLSSKATGSNGGKNLYDSDDLLDFKKPSETPIAIKGRPITERKRVWTTSLRSPRDLLKTRKSTTTSMTKIHRSPYHSKPVPAPVIKSTGKRVFHRAMQEAPASDALCALSDEENEEMESQSEKKSIRYPLPTMPLSIMVSLKDVPGVVVPMDFQTVLNKVSRYDRDIASLMESRQRLASSYALFDDLCTSFRGPENLDRFLRSLVYPKPAPQSTSGEQNSKPLSAPNSTPQASKPVNAATPLTYSSTYQQVTHPVYHANSSVGGSSTISSTSTESRLYRTTVSMKMKQVDSTNHKSKHITSANEVSEANHMRKPISGQMSRNAAKRAKKQINRQSPNPPPIPEEDAREDMLQRVRRSLMNLPWLGRARRNSSSSRSSQDSSSQVVIIPNSVSGLG